MGKTAVGKAPDKTSETAGSPASTPIHGTVNLGSVGPETAFLQAPIKVCGHIHNGGEEWGACTIFAFDPGSIL